MPNTANAVWTGALQEGSGKVRLADGAFEGSYTFKSRFEDAEAGTNPEELIAAAHAACISMAASGELGRAGIQVESVETTANVRIRTIDGAPTIDRIKLDQTINAPGADESAVRQAADAAKAGCPVSRALASVPEIELDVTVNV
jgi:osmotically inducible protein OsmC